MRSWFARRVGEWGLPLWLIGLWAAFWVLSYANDLLAIWVHPDPTYLPVRNPWLLAIQSALETLSLIVASIAPGPGAVAIWLAMLPTPITRIDSMSIIAVPLVTATLIVWGRRGWLVAHLSITAVWIAVETFQHPPAFLWTAVLFLLVGVAVGMFVSRVLAGRARDAMARAAAEEALADERDRRRQLLHELATELHDAVASELTMISLEASHVATSTEVDELKAALASTQQSARLAQAELRTLLDVLRESGLSDAAARSAPTVAEGEGLAGELRRLVEVLRGRGFTVVEQVSLDNERPELPAHLRHATLRIVQEAVANVLKHATPGSECRLTVLHDETGLRVLVANDLPSTPHLDSTDTPGSGIGLASIAERAALLGGILTAGERDGQWEVSARFSLPAARLGGYDSSESASGSPS